MLCNQPHLHKESVGVLTHLSVNSPKNSLYCNLGKYKLDYISLLLHLLTPEHTGKQVKYTNISAGAATTQRRANIDPSGLNKQHLGSL